MNISDVIIIYLTGGAPFAVYYYLQNRQRLFLRQLILMTVLNLIFWIPLSIRLLLNRIFQRNSDARNRSETTDIEIKVGTVQTRLDKLVGENFSGSEFYQFKEVSARYAGLSLALLGGENFQGAPDENIFQFTESENRELGSICLRRRNSQKLSHHQKLAGENFADAVIEIFVEIDNKAAVERFSLELTEILNDQPTNRKLRQYFQADKQKVSKSSDDFAENISRKNSPSKLMNSESMMVNLTAFKQVE